MACGIHLESPRANLCKLLVPLGVLAILLISALTDANDHELASPNPVGLLSLGVPREGVKTASGAPQLMILVSCLTFTMVSGVVIDADTVLTGDRDLSSDKGAPPNCPAGVTFITLAGPNTGISTIP